MTTRIASIADALRNNAAQVKEVARHIEQVGVQIDKRKATLADMLCKFLCAEFPEIDPDIAEGVEGYAILPTVRDKFVDAARTYALVCGDVVVSLYEKGEALHGDAASLEAVANNLCPYAIPFPGRSDPSAPVAKIVTPDDVIGAVLSGEDVSIADILATEPPTGPPAEMIKNGEVLLTPEVAAELLSSEPVGNVVFPETNGSPLHTALSVVLGEEIRTESVPSVQPVLPVASPAGLDGVIEGLSSGVYRAPISACVQVTGTIRRVKLPTPVKTVNLLDNTVPVSILGGREDDPSLTGSDEKPVRRTVKCIDCDGEMYEDEACEPCFQTRNTEEDAHDDMEEWHREFEERVANLIEDEETVAVASNDPAATADAPVLSPVKCEDCNEAIPVAPGYCEPCYDSRVSATNHEDEYTNSSNAHPDPEDEDKARAQVAAVEAANIDKIIQQAATSPNPVVDNTEEVSLDQVRAALLLAYPNLYIVGPDDGGFYIVTPPQEEPVKVKKTKRLNKNSFKKEEDAWQRAFHNEQETIRKVTSK